MRTGRITSVYLRVTPEEWGQFKRYALARGTSASALLTNAVKYVVELVGEGGVIDESTAAAGIVEGAGGAVEGAAGVGTGLESPGGGEIESGGVSPRGPFA